VNTIKAIVKIQCALSIALIEQKISSLRYATIKVQSYQRGYLDRKQFKDQKAATVMIRVCIIAINVIKNMNYVERLQLKYKALLEVY